MRSVTLTKLVGSAMPAVPNLKRRSRINVEDYRSIGEFMGE